MKKIIFGLFIVVLALVTAFNVNLNFSRENDLSMLSMANIEALAFEQGNVEWWDYFNNHNGPAEKIPVTTTNCVNGRLTYKGITVSVSSCTNYSFVIYTPCFDGGNRDECTSDNIRYI